MKSECKFFLNPLDSNTPNIAKDIFIFPIEEGMQKIIPSCEKVLTLQKPVGKITKIHEIWMRY